MADDAKRLLRYIVQNLVLPVEAKEAQLDASAAQDVPGEIDALTASNMEEAERLAPYFARGIALARQSGGRITVDDTDDEGNGIADAFARFLVVPNLATSQSEELSEGHYRYTFDVDWQRLSELARKAGMNL
ncbi:MAG TPA: hypothetical protein VJ183_07160 [Chloroflexia bacterium]|nr:hypothetical protein [Chloroflexia bacterium]